MASGRPARWAVPLAALIALWAAWRWTPLNEYVELSAILGWAASIRESPHAALIVPVGFTLAALVMIPITPLNLATVLAFGWERGFLFALFGSLVAAAATYAVGRLVGTDSLDRLAGRRLQRATRSFRRHGLMSVTAVRVVPAAPFTIVNLAAGAARVPFTTYMAGTLLGMAPGILMLALFGFQLVRAARDPGPITIAAMVLTGAAVVGVCWYVGRRVGIRG